MGHHREFSLTVAMGGMSFIGSTNVPELQRGLAGVIAADTCGSVAKSG
jgi:hypothetical protein